MRAATGHAGLTLADLRARRDRARAEYLAASRKSPAASGRSQERGPLWRAYLEANAAYERANAGEAAQR